MEILKQFNSISVLVRLLLAFVCGMLLGISAEYKRKPAGMRTHTLVCIGAATASMTGFYAYNILNLNIDPLRTAAQVISGIGFLGVGTILIRSRSQVLGLTTAAGLWVSAAVGISLGAGFYLGGIMSTALSLIVIIGLQRVEKRTLRRIKSIDIYMEIKNSNNVNQVVRKLQSSSYSIHHVRVSPAISGIVNHIGIEITLTISTRIDTQDVLDKFALLDEISFAIESE